MSIIQIVQLPGLKWAMIVEADDEERRQFAAVKGYVEDDDVTHINLSLGEWVDAWTIFARESGATTMIVSPTPVTVLRNPDADMPQHLGIGRCPSMSDITVDGSGPHECAFMEHTGRHQCARLGCGPDHTWGPVEQAHGPVYSDPPKLSLFDQIELAATDYRYRNALAQGTRLCVAVKGGLGRLTGAASRELGLPAISGGQIRAWLNARDLDLVYGYRGNADIWIFEREADDPQSAIPDELPRME